jgi:hypothetical protein
MTGGFGLTAGSTCYPVFPPFLVVIVVQQYFQLGQVGNTAFKARAMKTPPRKPVMQLKTAAISPGAHGQKQA